jgi:enoyl-CoA hydratase/carnithine racemase
MPLARLGLVIPADAARRLIEIVGPAFTSELLLTGEIVDAQRALQMGIATRLEPESELVQRARELAVRIAANAPLAVREMKRVITQLLPGTDSHVVEELNSARIRISQSADLREGLRAFLERRTPVFSGR